ncbi:GNAT family N-acetyltransferase [Ideonella livida]|uniref:N-acetyltransferase n=1 Tax=Ideonella livida TaxID=2707176 RepID=A0A7C9PEA5_9BURK|nr:GNAT family N-acetyltransferase [Ideonella livida]NDY89575.1 N-acetyltransferase [Ideonella livida]
MSYLPPDVPSSERLIIHNREACCFETEVDGLRCVADYRLEGAVMALTHTGVPRALEGRGIAAQLMTAALDHARTQGLKVRPVCSYAVVYMRRHPETQDLLAD